MVYRGEIMDFMFIVGFMCVVVVFKQKRVIEVDCF